MTAARSRASTKSEYEAMDKDDLVREAEKRGITVTRSDGEEGEPLKSDYVDALSGGDTQADGAPAAKDQHAHGNEPASGAGLPSQTSASAPVGVETTTGLPPARGKPVAGQPSAFGRRSRETDEERDARLQEAEERGVLVRATRAGEYPPGILRDVGNVFTYVRSEREHEEDAPLPTWVEAIDEDGNVDDSYETRVPGEPLFDADKDE